MKLYTEELLTLLGDIHANLEQYGYLTTDTEKRLNDALNSEGIELPDEEEIEKTAKKYAIEHSNAPDKDTPDWIMADFKAGVNFILNIIKEQAK